MRLAGQRALVTGGGRGIGRAIAAKLTQAGADVTIMGRDADRLQAAASAGAANAWLAADVADPDAMGEALSGRSFEIVVANAGAAESGPFLKSDAARFRRMMDVNLIGTVNAFRAALPAMLEARAGRLVAVASTAGLRGYPYVSAYVAAKHAVVGLVRGLALETARTGVTVNAICPGYTDTDLVSGSLAAISAKTGRSTDEALAELVKGNPQGRLVHPDEVASAVLWLCGPGSDAVTGQAIAINGGEF